MMAEVARAAGVQVYVWSSLPDIERLSGGKLVSPKPVLLATAFADTDTCLLAAARLLLQHEGQGVGGRSAHGLPCGLCGGGRVRVCCLPRHSLGAKRRGPTCFHAGRTSATSGTTLSSQRSLRNQTVPWS